VTVEALRVGDAALPPNSADAVIEQIIYHGFVSHLYLRQHNGDPLIAFQQNQGNRPGPALIAGMTVRARWAEASNHIVRD
jgi:putative spermidine/putrescine transport system ATP-binding protein